MMNYKEESQTTSHKLYKRRWFMIMLFTIFNFICASHWAQYTIINNLVAKYYSVSSTEVEWTANIFTVFYGILSIPSLFLRDKMLISMKYTLIISCLGIIASDWLKLFAVHPDRFVYVLIAQGIAAISVMLTAGMTGPFTSRWCGVREISTATVITIFGDQLGTSFSLIFPPSIVKHENIEIGLSRMNLIILICSGVTLLLIILFMQEKPKIPPSIAQVKMKQREKKGIAKDIINLFKNQAFVLLMISYSLSVGVFGGIIILLNELIVMNFGTEVTAHVGKMGALMIISGMMGSLIIGRIMDKTSLFKESAVFLTLCSSISILFFTWSLKSDSIVSVYFSTSILGFFILGFYSTGFQLGLEVTYPISEEITVAIMFLVCHLCSSFSTIVYSFTVKRFGDVTSNIGIFVMFLLSTLAALFIPARLKRQETENSVLPL